MQVISPRRVKRQTSQVQGDKTCLGGHPLTSRQAGPLRLQVGRDVCQVVNSEERS